MSILKPSDVFKAFAEKEINSESAVDYLKFIIENQDDPFVRRDAIETFEKIQYKSKKTFKFLENLLISDVDNRIRAKAAKIIIQNFSFAAFKPIKWAICRDNSLVCLDEIANALVETRDKNLKPLLDLIEHAFYKHKIYLVKYYSLNLSKIGVNKIKNVKKLNNLKSLIWLDLSHNNINEISDLESLSQLKNLSLANNKISEIKGLDKLSNLITLQLNNNDISEIKGLDSLTNLRSLVLDNNNIKEIKGLENLPKLHFLSLNNNRISTIKGLDKLYNLVILQLIGNEIQEISGLINLKELTTLNLSNNKIKNINQPNLPHLRYFCLDNNLIDQYQLNEYNSNLRRIMYFHYL